MSGADFESIIGGSFPSQDELPSQMELWYAYDLDNAYEHIEPNSNVGAIAFDLHEALIDTAIEYDDVKQKYDTERDRQLYADEIAGSRQACEVAEARHKVFEGMYYDLRGVQDAAIAGYPAAGGYEGTVSEALQRGIKELDRIWMPADIKPELVSLNYEIAAFLTLESGLHFRGLSN